MLIRLLELTLGPLLRRRGKTMILIWKRRQ